MPSYAHTVHIQFPLPSAPPQKKKLLDDKVPARPPGSSYPVPRELSDSVEEKYSTIIQPFFNPLLI
jgi:hypothetical protein